MTHAQYYKEHDRDSCSDTAVNNATAEGSTGCARCTALLLDERETLLASLQALAKAGRRMVRAKSQLAKDVLELEFVDRLVESEVLLNETKVTPK